MQKSHGEAFTRGYTLTREITVFDLEAWSHQTQYRRRCPSQSRRVDCFECWNFREVLPLPPQRQARTVPQLPRLNKSEKNNI